MKKLKNVWKKMSILLLAVMMVFAIREEAFAAVTAGDLANPVVDTATHYKGGEHKTTYHYVYFGYYPQKEIKKEEITDALRNAPYDENGDAVVNGKKYRRMTWEMKTVTGTMNEETRGAWDPISDNGYRYFQYEPIKWKILNNDGKKLFLLSDIALDQQQMHDYTVFDGSWETYYLRKWLNYDGTDLHLPHPYKSKGFMGFAFNKAEQSRILTTRVVQDTNYRFNTVCGKDTEDKIFLLSCSEITNPAYGFCNLINPKEDMFLPCGQIKVKGSAYAGAQGRYERVLGSWLRTRGERSCDIMDTEGYWCSSYGSGINYFCGVLPALNASYQLSDCLRINFETNGAGSIEEQILLGSGYVKEPPVLEKKDYIFCGWYEDKACTIPYEFNRPLTKDTTLYASWKQYKKVSFETNGAGSIEAQTILEGNPVVKPADPIKTGYVFTGWYTDVACTVPYDFTAGVATDMVLYAGWKKEGASDNTTSGDNATSADNTTIANNATFTEGGRMYKITSVKSKTVEYQGLEAYKAKKATRLTVPSTVTCNNVTYKVTSIAKNACKNYKKLKKVTIGKYVTKIGDNAFYGCSKLTTVTFKGSKVTKIGARAFKKCSSLKSISLPKDLKEIGKEAFRDCKKLSKITFKGTSFKKAGKNCFKNIYKKATFKVPKKKYNAYKKLIKKNTGYKSSMKIKK